MKFEIHIVPWDSPYSDDNYKINVVHRTDNLIYGYNKIVPDEIVEWHLLEVLREMKQAIRENVNNGNTEKTG